MQKIRSKSPFYLMLFVILLIRDCCQILSPFLGELGRIDWSLKSQKQIIPGKMKPDLFVQIWLMVYAKFCDNRKGFLKNINVLVLKNLTYFLYIRIFY